MGFYTTIRNTTTYIKATHGDQASSCATDCCAYFTVLSPNRKITLYLMAVLLTQWGKVSALNQMFWDVHCINTHQFDVHLWCKSSPHSCFVPDTFSTQHTFGHANCECLFVLLIIIIPTPKPVCRLHTLGLIQRDVCASLGCLLCLALQQFLLWITSLKRYGDWVPPPPQDVWHGTWFTAQLQDHTC